MAIIYKNGNPLEDETTVQENIESPIHNHSEEPHNNTISGVSLIGSNNYARRHSSGVAMDLYNVARDEIAQTIATIGDAYPIEATLYRSYESDPTSQLAYDTLSISLCLDGKVVVLNFFVTLTRIGDFGTYTVTLHDGVSVTIQKLPSDIDDDNFRNIITNNMIDKYTVNPTDVHILPITVIYREFDIKDAPNMFITAINIVTMYMEIHVLRVRTDLSLAELHNTTATGLNVNVRKVHNVDDSAANLVVSMSVASRENNQRSENVGRNNTVVGDALVSSGLIYVGNAESVAHTFNSSGVLPSERKCFSSVLIVESFVDDSPTLGRQLLLLSGATAILRTGIIHSTLTPEILSHLNIRANITNSTTPQPIDIEEVNQNYHAALDNLISDDVHFGIVIRKGHISANFTRFWINEGSLCPSIREAADVLSGGRFSMMVPEGMPLVSDSYEIRFTGVYPNAQGVDRPLSEITIDKLLADMPNQVTLHHKWILSQSTTNIREATALKKDVYDAYCTKGYVIHDVQYVVYILGHTLTALSSCLENAGIPVKSNADTFSSQQFDWRPHVAASAGINLNTTRMSNFGNVPSAGGTIYI